MKSESDCGKYKKKKKAFQVISTLNCYYKCRDQLASKFLEILSQNTELNADRKTSNLKFTIHSVIFTMVSYKNMH